MKGTRPMGTVLCAVEGPSLWQAAATPCPHTRHHLRVQPRRVDHRRHAQLHLLAAVCVPDTQAVQGCAHAAALHPRMQRGGAPSCLKLTVELRHQAARQARGVSSAALPHRSADCCWCGRYQQQIAATRLAQQSQLGSNRHLGTQLCEPLLRLCPPPPPHLWLSTMPVEGDSRPATQHTAGSKPATSSAVSSRRSDTPLAAPCAASACSAPSCESLVATTSLPRRLCGTPWRWQKE